MFVSRRFCMSRQKLESLVFKRQMLSLLILLWCDMSNINEEDFWSVYECKSTSNQIMPPFLNSFHDDISSIFHCGVVPFVAWESWKGMQWQNLNRPFRQRRGESIIDCHIHGIPDSSLQLFKRIGNLGQVRETIVTGQTLSERCDIRFELCENSPSAYRCDFKFVAETVHKNWRLSGSGLMDPLEISYPRRHVW